MLNPQNPALSAAFPFSNHEKEIQSLLDPSIYTLKITAASVTSLTTLLIYPHLQNRLVWRFLRLAQPLTCHSERRKPRPRHHSW